MQQRDVFKGSNVELVSLRRAQPIKDMTSSRSRGRTCVGKKARGPAPRVEDETQARGRVEDEDLAHSAVATDDQYTAAVCRREGRDPVFARTFDHVPRMPGVFCHFDLVRYAPLVEQGFHLMCM
jgi:hypothetical protein